MSKLQIHSVSITWSVSRGRDTYGWNICKATSLQTGKTYRTIGGGYDMLGTVIGEWFASEYQDILQNLACNSVTDDSKYIIPNFYGLSIYPDGSVYLDGACGIEYMLRIIEACGFDIQRQHNPRTKSKSTTGYLISKIIGD